jgi:hypothetical protein
MEDERDVQLLPYNPDLDLHHVKVSMGLFVDPDVFLQC